MGSEALVRWQHPGRGLLAPADFLDLAEEQGLMTRLTEVVLKKATQQAAKWTQLWTPLRIANNVSASSLADPYLQFLINRSLISAGLAPNLLTVEITETAFMTNPERALAAVRQIAAAGVGVSIDDYGTGYASLSYLNDLAADEVKLDRSLIANVVVSERSAAIVAGTVELARRLHMRDVAEGVEDQATSDALRALGCDEMQGYFYGKPASAAELTERSAGGVTQNRVAAVNRSA